MSLFEGNLGCYYQNWVHLDKAVELHQQLLKKRRARNSEKAGAVGSTHPPWLLITFPTQQHRKM
jgi:hypothetical protein